MTIQVEQRNVYGSIKFYPVNQLAEQFADPTGLTGQGQLTVLNATNQSTTLDQAIDFAHSALGMLLHGERGVRCPHLHAYHCKRSLQLMGEHGQEATLLLPLGALVLG